MLTSIDAIAGQVGFSVDGPGKIDLGRNARRRAHYIGDDVLRYSRRKNVTSGEDRGIRLAGPK